MKRFQRQIQLDEVGLSGQQALSHARVLVIGAGGLGTPAALYLAAAGIGLITLIDGDNVAESNLHRQVMFTNDDIGKNKATALAHHLKLRSQSEIHGRAEYLDQHSALTLFSNHDVIIDGTDNFSAKYLINDMAVLLNRPVVYGAISQFEGRVSVFSGGPGQPCYRCLFPDFPKAKIQNCAEAGVLGPLPGMIGTLQAMEAIKWILSKGSSSPLRPLMGKMQILSLATNESEILPIKKRESCICNRSNLTLGDLPERPEQPTCSLRNLSELDISGRQIIDVRTKEEWDDFHIESSLHWPIDRFKQSQFPDLDPGQSYLLVCKSGARAKQAHAFLASKPDIEFDVIAYPGSLYELAFN